VSRRFNRQPAQDSDVVKLS